MREERKEKRIKEGKSWAWENNTGWGKKDGLVRKEGKLGDVGEKTKDKTN